MDEKRVQAYIELIQALLNCVRGDEPKILRANKHLIDEGLLETIEQVADILIKEDATNTANWLRTLAAQLANYLNSSSITFTHQEYLEFLDQLLVAITRSNGDAQVVYPLLQANLSKLNLVFANLLEAWATVTLPKFHPEIVQSIAIDISNLSDLIYMFPLGNRADNIEIAILGYEIVLKIFTRDRFPEHWAITQNNLGTTYANRIYGERIKNLETAVSCYQQALSEYASKNGQQHRDHKTGSE